MLALLLQRELERCWAGLDITVKDGMDELAAIHTETVHIGNMNIRNIPEPNTIGKEFLEKAMVSLPSALP